ncbi:MAG: hypothetical protein JXM70_12640 [Pirellulales bacterium]|nr:hypothetical protein [Pirellulales bacterium]
MSTHYCPCCGAELLSSLFMGSWKQIECPSCNEWIDVDVVAPGMTHHREQEDDDVADRYDDVEDDPPSDRLDEWRDGERLVIHILSGSNGLVGSLASAIVIISGILGFFTWNSIWGGGEDSLHVLVFLGLAWMFVASMMGAWIFARFGSTSVMVEPTRLVVEQRLFGTRKTREYRLGLRSKASLIASHRLWGDLVHGVRIGAVGEQPVIAVWLLPGEKRWIARRINRHLCHADWEYPQEDDTADVAWSIMDGFSWGE